VESTNAKRDAWQLITTARETIQTDRLHTIEKLIIVETKDFTIPSVSLNVQHKQTENVSTTHSTIYAFYNRTCNTNLQQNLLHGYEH
jgi:protease II